MEMWQEIIVKKSNGRYGQLVPKGHILRKEKHAMRYTHHRGLARVSRWVKLKFAAMNRKKLANWLWKEPRFSWFRLSLGTFSKELKTSEVFLCGKIADLYYHNFLVPIKNYARKKDTNWNQNGNTKETNAGKVP